MGDFTGRGNSPWPKPDWPVVIFLIGGFTLAGLSNLVASIAWVVGCVSFYIIGRKEAPRD